MTKFAPTLRSHAPDGNNVWTSRLAFATLLTTGALVAPACEDSPNDAMNNPSLDSTSSAESGGLQKDTENSEDSMLVDTSGGEGESSTGIASGTTEMETTTANSSSTGSEGGSTEGEGTGDTLDSTTESPSEIPGKLDYDEKLKTLLFNGSQVYGPVIDSLNTKFVYEKNSCATNPEKAVQCSHDPNLDKWSCDVQINMGDKPYKDCTITVFATGRELTDNPNEDFLKGPENPRNFEITQ